MLAKRAPLPELPITDTRMLAAFLDNASTPPEQSRIHCAMESFPYRLSSLQPVGYDENMGLLDFMTGMGAFGWQPIIEDNATVGVRRGTSHLKLQEGTRMRIACGEAKTLHEVANELDTIASEINQIGTDLNLGFLCAGFHPTAKPDDIIDPPGVRFRVIEEALAERKDNALDVLRRSCGARVTLTYANEQDMVKKFRIATAVQPAVTALFANSPFADGKITDNASTRMGMRVKLISGNDTLLPRIYANSFGFESFAEWAVDQPMLYVKRNGRIINTQKHTFRDFIDGSNQTLSDYELTSGDWDQHMKQILGDISLTGGLTMQGVDAGPSEMMLALTAFWTGLLCDKTAMENALGMIKNWKPKDIGLFRAEAPHAGFDAKINGHKAGDVAQEIVKIAMHGLNRRANLIYGGVDEGRYLQVLFDYIGTRQNRADRFRGQQQCFSDFSLRTVFDACRLKAPPVVD